MPSKRKLLEEFFGSVITLRQIAKQLSEVSFEDHVATMLQIQALSCLNKNPRSTVGELANNLGLSSSAVAQLVERLIKAQLIKKKIDLKDKRVGHLSLSLSGERKLQILKEKRFEKMKQVFSELPEKDIKVLIRIIGDLIKILEKKKI